MNSAPDARRPMHAADVQAAMRRMADEVALLMWTLDEQGTCVRLNREAMDYLQWPQQFSFEVWRSFIHADDLPRVCETVDEARRTGSDYRLHYRLLRSDGSVRWMLGLGAPRLDAQGRQVGYCGTLADMSDSQLLLQHLAASEEAHRLLAENATDLISHHRPDGSYLYTSPSCEQVLGYSQADLTGRNAYELIHAEDLPGLAAEVEAQMRTRRQPRPLELRLRKRDGDFVWLSTALRVIFDHRTGEPKGSVAVSRDITEERQIRQQLQAREERYRSLTTLTSDWYWETDPDNRFTLVTEGAAGWLGGDPSLLLGKSRQDIAADPRDPGLLAALDKFARREPFRDIVYAAVPGPGMDRTELCIAGEPMYRDGVFAGYRGLTRDVTGQRRARDELQRAHSRLEAVLESIDDAFFSYDHELRLIYCNSAALPWTEIPADELPGKHLFLDIEPGLKGTVFEDRFREVLATRESVQFEAYYALRDVWLWVRAYPSGEGLSVFFHNISAHKAAEAALARSEARFARLIESTPEGYFLATADLRIAEVNPALCRMTGHARQELVGQPLSTLFSRCPLAGAFLPGDRSGRNTFDLDDVTIRHRSGRVLHALMNATIERDAQGAPVSLTAFLNDITDRKLAEQRLEHLATHDQLTGLPNRALLVQRLAAMIPAAAQAGESLAVLFIDLDRFKEVNDSMGHKAGDRLLKEVALRLGEQLRPGDVVARLGGDEFVVLVPCSQGAKSAMAVAEKLLERLKAPVAIGGQEVFVAASIGISLYPQDGEDDEALFQNADIAMYRAKAAGRNGYRFFTQEMQEAARTRLKLESALRRALERGEFEVHYQPRLDLATLEVVGMEALLRWNHPQLGRVPPAQFIPLAEETGLIGEIGNWVLQQACRQNRAWVETFGRELSVSVNLSPRQLHDPQLIPKVRCALHEAGMAPRLLELELTEGALMLDPDSAAQILGELKELGLRLSVDDFGTGHSSLAYLRRFPLDVLKLDRTFLTELTGNADAAASADLGRLAQAVIHLAHTLRLRVVAEGVETREVFQFLKEGGCDEAQGYHLCRPLPPQEFEQFLRSRGKVRGGSA